MGRRSGRVVFLSKTKVFSWSIDRQAGRRFWQRKCFLRGHFSDAFCSGVIFFERLYGVGLAEKIKPYEQHPAIEYPERSVKHGLTGGHFLNEMAHCIPQVARAPLRYTGGDPPRRRPEG